MAGGIRKVLGLAQQRFPFMPRQAAVLEIGARPFAAVVEEADVVVGLFQRFDLARDESLTYRDGDRQRLRARLVVLPVTVVFGGDQFLRG